MYCVPGFHREVLFASCEAMTFVWNAHSMSWKAHAAMTFFWNSHIMTWKAHAAMTFFWKAHIMS